MINIVLIEPEIPQNTGNIARTCAALGAKLHLVKPFSFDISEKAVRRAGLDYWKFLNLEVHDSIDSFIAEHAGKSFYFCSTKAENTYTDVKYADDPFLLFGPETRGLPESMMFGKLGENDRKYYPNFSHKKLDGTAIKIPMVDKIRSLNLSNAAAIVAYEVVRQKGLI